VKRTVQPLLHRRAVRPFRGRVWRGIRWLGWAHDMASRYRRRTMYASPAGVVLLFGMTGRRSSPSAPSVRIAKPHPVIRRQPPASYAPGAAAASTRRRHHPPYSGPMVPRPLVVGLPIVAVAARARRRATTRSGDRGQVIHRHLNSPAETSRGRAAPAPAQPAEAPAAALALGADALATRHQQVARRIVERGRRVEPAIVTRYQQVARRIVERGRRVEPATGRPVLPASGELGGTRRATPYESIAPAPAVRRPVPGAARPEYYPASAPSPPTAWASPTSRATTAGADPADRLDVDLLADRVVRRIDERIIAHRERLGRI
jgi:hypothetical protein